MRGFGSALCHRRGDAAEVAQVELLGSEYDPNASTAQADGSPEQAKTLRGGARAAVKKLQDEGAAKDTSDTRPKGVRKTPTRTPRRTP